MAGQLAEVHNVFAQQVIAPRHNRHIGAELMDFFLVAGRRRAARLPQIPAEIPPGDLAY